MSRNTAPSFVVVDMKTNAFDALAGLAIRVRDKAVAGMTIRRALYLAVLLLPGTIVVLPVLMWLDRRAVRRRAPGDHNACTIISAPAATTTAPMCAPTRAHVARR